MRRARPLAVLPALGLALAALATGCGDDTSEAASATGAGDRATIVVTTTILGAVVGDLVGDAAEVTVLMPPGADPHDFQLSARQAAELREANVLITNGAGFEEGMADALEAAEGDGVVTHHAIDAVETIEVGEGGHSHDDESEGGHSDEEEEGGAGHDEEDGHDHEGEDPHFFTDPERMADAAEGIVDFLTAEVPALDTDEVRTGAETVVEDLRDLAAEVDEILAPLAADARTLVTNHDVFGYFADRFEFEVVGVVISGGGTGGEPSARDLAELAETIETEEVPAIFADVSSPETLSAALASEVGDVEVVELFSESLGEEGSDAETYAGMVRTNAERIVDALS